MENSDQQSGANIGSNDDLLTEILLRLPAASILRFKSVSKHWRSLLTHIHFTHRFDNLSKSPGIFAGNTYVPFDVKNRSIPPFRSIDSYFDRPRVRIVQSCNGLLLCYTDRGALRYYVFNPTTKQLAIIPSIPGILKGRNTIRFMGLAFHQTDCVHFKLVCIHALDPDGELFRIQIYSSDTRKWKIVVESCAAFGPIISHGVYWNGAVFCSFYHSRNRLYHLYFKIDAEKLLTVRLPDGLLSSRVLTTMYLGESKGHLHLIAYKTRRENSLRLNVYEMLSDRSGWFVKYQLQLDELAAAFPEMISEYGFGFSVIDVVRGEEEEDTVIVLKISEKSMITYNVHDKSFKQIHSFSGHWYDYVHSFHRYIQTLSSF